MDVTEMLSYQRWRNRLQMKGFSRLLSIGGESFQPSVLRHASALLEKERELNPFERSQMFNLPNDRDEQEMRRLLDELSRIYRKEKVFRKDKVEEIKRRIRLNQYNIPGKWVVDKWFSDDSEK